MRQELVDVSIMLQLIDKNNFHVVYSASSSANMPGTARLSAKVLPILQFYACTQQEEMCSSLTLSFPHIRVQPCADSAHSRVPPHIHTHDSDTHAHVHIQETPGCLHMGTHQMLSDTQVCLYCDIQKHTFSPPSQAQSCQYKGVRMFEDAFKGLHSSPIHSPPKHSHIPQHRYHMQIPYPLDILRHKLIFIYLYTRCMHTTCIFEHTCKRTQIHCKPTEKYFQVTFMYVCVKQPRWEMNCWQFCRGKSCFLLKIKFFASSQFIIVAETWSSFKLQVFVTVINIKDSSQTSLREQNILSYSLWPAYSQLQCHHCYLYCSSTRSKARDQEPTVLGPVQSDPDFKEFIANPWIPPCPVQHNSRFQW